MLPTCSGTLQTPVGSGRPSRKRASWALRVVGGCVQDGAPREAGIGIVQELCESRGGRPGLSVLTSLVVSADVKQY